MDLLPLLFEIYCEPSKSPLVINGINGVTIEQQLNILKLENLSLQKIRKYITVSLYDKLPELKNNVYKRIRFKSILLFYYRSYTQLQTTSMKEWTPKQLSLSLLIYLIKYMQQKIYTDDENIKQILTKDEKRFAATSCQFIYYLFRFCNEEQFGGKALYKFCCEIRGKHGATFIQKICKKYALKFDEFSMMKKHVGLWLKQEAKIQKKTISATQQQKTPMSENKMTGIDVTVFERNEFSNIYCRDYKDKTTAKCHALQRMCTGLKYFEMLFADKTNVTMTEEEKQNIFVHFNDVVYKKQILNDYVHIIQKHNDTEQLIEIEKDLKRIYNIKTCNISTCDKVIRHYREQDVVKDEVSDPDNTTHDPKYEFYRDLCDNFHFQIFHLIHMGLRSTIQNDMIETNQFNIHTYNLESNVDDGASLVNKEFENKRDLLEKQKKSVLIDNYMEKYTGKNNKFTIPVHIKNTKNEKESENTFLDSMFSHVEVQNENIDKVKAYLDENEFDSDAVQADLEDAATSNICKKFGYGIGGSGLMFNYVRKFQLSTTSFSTGYQFFYWKYHRNLSKEQVEKQYDRKYKYTQYNGYSLYDLLISARYASLKEEILASGYVTQQQWNQNIAFKAMEYLDAEKVKKIKCKSGGYAKEHDMDTNTPISFYHLCCIILYCDITALCTAFSATFIKKSAFETLKGLKRRHAKFAIFAKGLVEAVTDFGIRGYKYDEEWELGPFFTGLDCVLCIPSFALCLQAPCSTSMDIEISLNFAKRRGYVLALQNDTEISQYQRFFDTSWISAYVEENERLFIACWGGLRLLSIRIIESEKHLKELCKGLFIFEVMLSGEAVGTMQMSRSDVDVCQTMLNSKLGIGLKKEIDEKWVNDSFDLFTAKKTHIILDMWKLENEFKDLNHFVFHSVVADSKGKKNTDENRNVINPKILSIFPFLREVVILDIYGRYSFNFQSFLSLIEASNPSIKYIIKAQERRWLSSSVTLPIQEAFNDKNWNIIQQKDGSYDVVSVLK